MFRYTLIVLAFIIASSNAYVVPDYDGNYLLYGPSFYGGPQLRNVKIFGQGQAGVQVDPYRFNLGFIKGTLGGQRNIRLTGQGQGGVEVDPTRFNLGFIKGTLGGQRNIKIHGQGQGGVELDPYRFNIGFIKGTLGGKVNGQGSGTIEIDTPTYIPA
ncbi:unnamed protein product [Diabrotica balteata]|uniref:Uncharacterized protein n=1 Tax=Diabrotica balteata TaxID=107213 RepID=A0A9N9SWG7_DIABA|nr:unnamed protein product [Diabrotica balteata]